MAKTHTFTSELDADPTEFTMFAAWMANKVGAEKAHEILAITDNLNHTFSSFYDAWIIDQKITHTITDAETKETKEIASYKSPIYTPERISFINNVVNTVVSGGKVD